MSSILTNNSAMVALQTLKSVNSSLQMTQSEISTGKSVSNAKDNAAVWSISKQMDSDVKGFQAISESLNLGQATVATARNASETVTDLLTEMKGRIVAAQEENVDRSAIQNDIDALADQIDSVVSSAQFNGLNLIDGSSTDAMNVLSSLDRGADGTVTASQITVDRQNLSVNTAASSQVFGTDDPADAATAALYASGGVGATDGDTAAFAGAAGTDYVAVANNTSETVTIGQVDEGVSYQISLGDMEVRTADGGTATASRDFQYVATANDGIADVASALTAQINAFFGAATESANAYTVSVGGTDNNEITITNGTGTTTNAALNVEVRVQLNGTPGSSASSGGLGAINTIDVTTDSGAASALTAIDGLINQATDAAASFGSDQGRIETQSDFVSKLTDSFKSGIGALVDADMEETSAKLQALQVQQQLAVQALSIANQAPQSILSLFR